MLHYVCLFVQLTIQYSTVQYITVHCSIQTVCCGFQFALQFGMFNLLLQYVCHFFSSQYSTVQCCILTVCCGFQFVLQFATFNLLLHYVCLSVDCQLTLHWILLIQLNIQNYRALCWLQLWGIGTIFHRALH